MLRRLRRLEQKDLLRRMGGLSSGNFAWCLTRNGSNRLGLKDSPGHFNRNTLDHDVLLSQVRLALASVGVGDNWTSEKVLRSQLWRYTERSGSEQLLVPDGIFTAKSAASSRAIAVELELTIKRRERYTRTLKAYHFKQNLGMVWYLVKSEQLGRILEEEWKRIDWHQRDERFTWSLVDEILRLPAATLIHTRRKAVRLSEFFGVGTVMKGGAHSPAHPVSISKDASPPTLATLTNRIF